jgi:unsaturated chondroitin disaccharide hydrolase
VTQDTPLEADDLNEALSAIVRRVQTTLESVDGAFPFVADPETGNWKTTADGNWCAGHWIGLLWIASDWSDEEAGTFERYAREYTSKMRNSPSLLKSMFGGMNYHYAGFRAYDISGDRSLFDLGVAGADAMVDLFEERAQQIPVGSYTIEGPAEQFDFSEETEQRAEGTEISAVDMVYTSVPVLWRAHVETDEQAFWDVALSHSDRHLDWYIREDGRTWQEAQFDPKTGDLVNQYNDLAYSNETCWARGQGWNIAGLARAYNETKAPRYLAALRKTVDYYVEMTPEDLVPHWDFEVASIPDTPRDTSAAALAAYGLARLQGPRADVDKL